MALESSISYWLSVREFRINLKKIVVRFEKFFKTSEEYSDNNQHTEIPTIELGI